jgi:hypothetical protein
MDAPPHLFKRRHFLGFENVNVTFVDNALPAAFLLEAESTPGSSCGRKDYVNEEFL